MLKKCVESIRTSQVPDEFPSLFGGLLSAESRKSDQDQNLSLVVVEIWRLVMVSVFLTPARMKSLLYVSTCAMSVYFRRRIGTAVSFW